MKTRVEDLREHLFAAIERLNEASREELDGEIARAKAVAEVAREITSTAKAEIEHLKITGQNHQAGKFFEPHRLPSLGDGGGLPAPPKTQRRNGGAHP